jgi:hypothetical protein
MFYLFIYVYVVLVCCVKTLADDNSPRNTPDSDAVDGWFVPFCESIVM